MWLLNPSATVSHHSSGLALFALWSLPPLSIGYRGKVCFCFFTLALHWLFFGIIGVMRSYSAYSMGHLFIYFLNVEVYLLYNGVNDTCRAEKRFGYGKSCVSLSCLLFMGSFKSHDWRRTWLLSNFCGCLPHPGVCPNPLPLRKCPLRVALWFIFFHHLHHHHPISWERLKLGKAPMGGKINLSVALCEDSGSGLGGGGLCQAEKRDVRVWMKADIQTKYQLKVREMGSLHFVPDVFHLFHTCFSLFQYISSVWDVFAEEHFCSALFLKQWAPPPSRCPHASVLLPCFRNLHSRSVSLLFSPSLFILFVVLLEGVRCGPDCRCP